MKLVSVLVISLVATSVWASKARVTALQYADHLVDVQTTFKNPAHINQLDSLLTVEMGAAGKAEGGLLTKTAFSNKVLVYAGHQNSMAIGAGADVRAANSYLTQNNPIEVLYGAGQMAYGASLSTVDNKKSGTKETTLIGKWGMVKDALSFYAHLSLVSTAEIKAATGDKKINAAPGLLIGGAKDSGNMRYFGSLIYGNAKNEVGTVSTDIKDMDIKIGAEDRSLKNANADIYYGGLLNHSTRDIGGSKITALYLPIFMGIEAPVTSWLTFRGSVSQNFLIGSVKDETATNTDADGVATNTTASAGLGAKYNNLTLDGVLTAGTSGDINGNQFLSTASVTYNF
jgi:hypothetical protein